MSTTQQTQTQPNKDAQTTQEKALKDLNMQGQVAAGFAISSLIFAILFAIFFSLGASVLSYRKFGSIGWAILDFFFAYFYYPYYAFFLDTSAPTQPPAAPTTAQTMVGGVVKMLGGKRRKH